MMANLIVQLNQPVSQITFLFPSFVNGSSTTISEIATLFDREIIHDLPKQLWTRHSHCVDLSTKLHCLANKLQAMFAMHYL